jgi:hypothetical protein
MKRILLAAAIALLITPVHAMSSPAYTKFIANKDSFVTQAVVIKTFIDRECADFAFVNQAQTAADTAANHFGPPSAAIVARANAKLKTVKLTCDSAFDSAFKLGKTAVSAAAYEKSPAGKAYSDEQNALGTAPGAGEEGD